MDIREAQDQVHQWIQTIGVRYFNELTNMTVLMEEVGELAKLAARIYGEQCFKKTKDEDKARENWEEELGDILFVLICLANQTDVDLEKVFQENLQKKTKRDQERHKFNKKLKS